MLHPFMPFVTEAIYGSLAEGALCVASWPTPFELNDERALAEVDVLISLITEIRTLKSEYKLKPAHPLNIMITQDNDAHFSLSEEHRAILEKMVKTTCVDSLAGETSQRSIVGGTLQAMMSELVDAEEERIRLIKELERLELEITRCEAMLSNERFISKAPADKIAEENRKLNEYKRQFDLAKEKAESLK